MSQLLSLAQDAVKARKAADNWKKLFGPDAVWIKLEAEAEQALHTAQLAVGQGVLDFDEYHAPAEKLVNAPELREDPPIFSVVWNEEAEAWDWDSLGIPHRGGVVPQEDGRYRVLVVRNPGPNAEEVFSEVYDTEAQAREVLDKWLQAPMADVAPPSEDQPDAEVGDDQQPEIEIAAAPWEWDRVLPESVPAVRPKNGAKSTWDFHVNGHRFRCGWVTAFSLGNDLVTATDENGRYEQDWISYAIETGAEAVEKVEQLIKARWPKIVAAQPDLEPEEAPAPKKRGRKKKEVVTE